MYNIARKKERDRKGREIQKGGETQKKERNK